MSMMVLGYDGTARRAAVLQAPFGEKWVISLSCYPFKILECCLGEKRSSVVIPLGLRH